MFNCCLFYNLLGIIETIVNVNGIAPDQGIGNVPITTTEVTVERRGRASPQWRQHQRRVRERRRAPRDARPPRPTTRSGTASAETARRRPPSATATETETTDVTRDTSLSRLLTLPPPHPNTPSPTFPVCQSSE